MNEPVTVGLIGYGLGGRVFHAPLVNAVPALRLHSVMSRSPEKRRQAEQDWGVPTVATVEELLDDPALDLVVISTPHDTHRALVTQALEAGKHVVVDKVMALSVAEADEMIAAADRAGKLLNVFQNRRWDGDFLTLQRVLAEGLLGEPLVCESAVARYRKRAFAWRQSATHGGGPFRDWGAHFVDQCLQLFGPVASVWADFIYSDEFEVETSAHCHLHHQSGVRSVIEAGSISRLERPRWYVRGTVGALLKTGLDPQEARLAQGLVEGVTPRAGDYERPEHWAEVVTDLAGAEARLRLQTLPGRYVTYYENIADVLLGGAEPLVKLGEVREELAVIDAAIASARTGEAVRL